MPPLPDVRPDDPHVDPRRILRLFRPYTGRLVLVGLLIAASSLVGLGSPFLLRGIIDNALPHKDTGLLALLALGMIGVAVVSTVVGVYQTLLSTTIGQRIMRDLRVAVYAHLQRMSLAFFTKTRTGEVQSRIANDIGGMQAIVTSTATSIVSNATVVVGSAIAMLAMDVRLALLSFVLLPGTVWINRRVGAMRRRLTTERQRRLALMTSQVQESLSVSGVLLGRSMGRSPELTERFAGDASGLADLEVRSQMAGKWQQSTISITFAAVPAVTYWLGGLALAGGSTVSIGTLVAFTTLQSSLFNPLNALLRTGVQVQSSLALFARIFEYLDLPVDIVESPAPVALPGVRGDVRFSGVSFAYEPGAPTLIDVSLEVPAGSTLAVVGATGSGKTTLGYLLGRLYDADSGSITIDGVDVRDLSLAALPSTVGVVSQDPYLLHASIAENLRFARPDATDDELVRAARAARIHDLIASLPEGYDTVVGERGYRFSGGEKQRLAIARTVLRNPPVLVLDEATSALDTRTERSVQAALDELSAGRTTVTVAHRLSTVRSADRIAVLDRGRVVELGSHDDLLALGGRYAELVAADGQVPVAA
ncbi:MAG TPA: ABC transporter ATP-binding protein, partial [Nocardioidaceae bacterium]|nr:ABC transporter ATP-binding protein [Nocardioidaceae bacterium]